MSGVIYVLAMAVAAVVAVAFVVTPLLRRRRAEAVSERQAELAAHRARFVELEADREAGNLSEAEYREAREELERQLLDGVETAAGDRGRGGGRAMAVVAGVVVPVFAVGVYLLVGRPEAVWPPSTPQPQMAAGEQSPERSRAFIEDNLTELQQRVEQRPEDVEAARMLARAYLVLDRPSEAASELDRIMARTGEEPVLLVDRARALALADQGRFTGEARKLLERALERAPAYPDALWFGGLAAAQAGDTARARALWQRLLTEMPQGSEAAQRLSTAIEQLGGGASGSGADADPAARVAVRVRVDDALATDLPADTTVFVFARVPNGPPMPVAAQRLTLGDLPTRVTLDDSMAMAGRSLADVEEVELIARVSRSGQPTPSPGDLEGQIGPITVNAEGAVELVIDRRR
ncbi:c-type cytochrome biogenesis protein CcmI [Arhodomonas sp. AD133]|uniref:c-type cytochrome biogenesis protein CcmI n=1 Tax=Arhodomonas sp. AD133 TaxID=3415009 RepID=UPI003EBFAE3B